MLLLQETKVEKKKFVNYFLVINEQYINHKIYFNLSELQLRLKTSYFLLAAINIRSHIFS